MYNNLYIVIVIMFSVYFFIFNQIFIEFLQNKLNSIFSNLLKIFAIQNLYLRNGTFVEIRICYSFNDSIFLADCDRCEMSFLSVTFNIYMLPNYTIYILYTILYSRMYSGLNAYVCYLLVREAIAS